MKEIIKEFGNKIRELEQEKKKYAQEEDQYSWEIVNDQQIEWKKALAIVQKYQN